MSEDYWCGSKILYGLNVSQSLIRIVSFQNGTSTQPQGGEKSRRMNWYMLPFRADDAKGDDNSSDTEEDIDFIRGKKVCTCGILKVMHMGHDRFHSVRTASITIGVPQPHKSTGKISNSAINDERANNLKVHFDRLLELGEVRATRAIATLMTANVDMTIERTPWTWFISHLRLDFTRVTSGTLRILGMQYLCVPM